MARVITPEAILSYPKLFTPEVTRNGDEKYGCALVFPTGTDLDPLKKAAVAVAVEKFGKTEAAKKIKSGEIRLMGGPYHSIRTDTEAKGYQDAVAFINARGNQRPGIVGIIPDKDGRPTPITDEDEIYPGCVVRASVSPFYYDVDGNRGIAWGLNNIQKLRDGERLDGRVPAADEFEADEDAVADLSDLTDEAEPEEDESAELDLSELVGA